MSYVRLLDSGVRKARRPHQCFDCYRTIPAGEVYAFSTCKYDHVYTICQHIDCRDASDHYRAIAGLRDYDFDDGIPPLADIIRDGGEFRHDVDCLRGHYPHVACRLDLNEQMADLRYLARCREAGFEPTQDDFQPIFG